MLTMNSHAPLDVATPAGDPIVSPAATPVVAPVAPAPRPATHVASRTPNPGVSNSPVFQSSEIRKSWKPLRLEAKNKQQSSFEQFSCPVCIHHPEQRFVKEPPETTVVEQHLRQIMLP